MHYYCEYNELFIYLRYISYICYVNKNFPIKQSSEFNGVLKSSFLKLKIDVPHHLIYTHSCPSIGSSL